jgi:hypothetical protein
MIADAILSTEVCRLLAASDMPDRLPLIWEFLHRITAARFHRLNEYMRADLTDEQEIKLRDDVLRVIGQAMKTGDSSLLEPPEILASVPAIDRV